MTDPAPTSNASAAWRRLLLSLVLLAGFGTGLAVEPWEFRVCADPDDYPTSSVDLTGYENRVAAILAEELGARLTYQWTTIDDFAVRHHLRGGDCDAMLSVAENAAGLLNTVAYYRMPFAFVTRANDPAPLTTLLPPLPQGMRIGVAPNSQLHMALTELGVVAAFVATPTDRSVNGLGRHRPMLDALRADEVDVVIFDAGYASAHVAAAGDLAFTSVEPEVVPPFTPMFRVATIGVRPGDEGLRDQLNRAIARRWDDIQAVFADMAIPLRDLPRPLAAPDDPEGPLRIGVIAPLRTGTPAVTDVVGTAAWFGARVADDLVGRAESRRDLPVEVVFANAPSAEAAVRAAWRLAATGRVAALVGGFAAGHAQSIAAVAAEAGVLFVNAGDQDDRLRSAVCFPTTFHVAPSDAMYADALAELYGPGQWFLVRADDAAGARLADRLATAVTAAGGRLDPDSVVAVPTGPVVYRDALQAVAAAAPDVVVVALAPADLEFFLAQASLERLDVPFVPFPDPVVQTRDFLTRLRDVAPEYVSSPRLAPWDPTLAAHGASEVNLRFASRSGEPMDPSGWAAYAGIEVVAGAYEATRSRDPLVLAAYLARPDARVNVLKGLGTSFRPWDHQLRQPLYVVEVDPGAPWGLQVSVRTALASVVAHLPDVSAEGIAPSVAFDRYGDGPVTRPCVP